MSFSILILTYNELANIRSCVESLNISVNGGPPLDIAVLDSGSTDGTVEALRELGIRIYHRPFDTFANQRNWGMDAIPWAFDWILHLDADERVDRGLIAEITEETQDSQRDAYLLANRLFFMGRWIRFSSRYPHYQARLLHRHRARFISRGHGQYLAESVRDVGRLHHPYDHHNFSKGISEWVEKHNRYATAEARQMATAPVSIATSFHCLLTSRSRETAQQALKALASALPLRPFARFGYLYVCRWGFLDGRPGFDYCVLMAFYEFLITIKRREIAANRS